MKKTLLQLTQDILNDMDADEVNSINDTIESQQVAVIVRTCYEELISNRNWPHLKQLIQIEHSGDVNKPTHMRAPDNLKEMEELLYDKSKDGSKKFDRVTYLSPTEFLLYIRNRNTDNANVIVVNDVNGVELNIVNDKAPDYYTTFDDEYLVFDSYNSAVDDALKKSKTQCVAYIMPTWEHVDSHVPNLPSEAFSLLFEESKSTAFFNLKQMVNDKAEQKAGRQNRWLSRKAWRIQGGIQYPNYGRK